jgi:hypothetical protein
MVRRESLINRCSVLKCVQTCEADNHFDHWFPSQHQFALMPELGKRRLQL